MKPAPSAGDLSTVLDSFGVEGVSIDRMARGSVNEHWRIETAFSHLVLRRYRPSRSTASIAFEHELLAYAAERGWPVAAPLLARSGHTIVRVRDDTWSLFPSLPGQPVGYAAVAPKRLKGRLLARFHEDMSGFHDRAQRPGSGREWELDVFVRAAGYDSFNGLLARFDRHYPDLATAVRRLKYQSLRELSKRGYGELPGIVVHRDFHHDNLLFAGGELTGLLDFDLARWDARVLDVAASLSLECLAAPDYDSIDPAMASAFLEGYASHTRLNEDEALMAPALVRACFLWLAMHRMAEWADTGSPRAVASIARTVDRRLPALQALEPELLRLSVSVAAGH